MEPATGEPHYQLNVRPVPTDDPRGWPTIVLHHANGTVTIRRDIPADEPPTVPPGAVVYYFARAVIEVTEANP